MNYLKSFVKGNEDAAPSGSETVGFLLILKIHR